MSNIESSGSIIHEEKSSLISEEKFGETIVFTFGERRYIPAGHLANVVLSVIVDHGDEPSMVTEIHGRVVESLASKGITDPISLATEQSVESTVDALAQYGDFVTVSAGVVIFSRKLFDSYVANMNAS
jgi:hypothetical protein